MQNAPHSSNKMFRIAHNNLMFGGVTDFPAAKALTMRNNADQFKLPLSLTIKKMVDFCRSFVFETLSRVNKVNEIDHFFQA
jgi:hypothetical protein